jgi:hypothetical protein
MAANASAVSSAAGNIGDVKASAETADEFVVVNLAPAQASAETVDGKSITFGSVKVAATQASAAAAVSATLSSVASTSGVKPAASSPVNLLALEVRREMAAERNEAEKTQKEVEKTQTAAALEALTKFDATRVREKMKAWILKHVKDRMRVGDTSLDLPEFGYTAYNPSLWGSVEEVVDDPNELVQYARYDELSRQFHFDNPLPPGNWKMSAKYPEVIDYWVLPPDHPSHLSTHSNDATTTTVSSISPAVTQSFNGKLFIKSVVDEFLRLHPYITHSFVGLDHQRERLSWKFDQH